MSVSYTLIIIFQSIDMLILKINHRNITDSVSYRKCPLYYTLYMCSSKSISFIGTTQHAEVIGQRYVRTTKLEWKQPGYCICKTSFVSTLICMKQQPFIVTKLSCFILHVFFFIVICLFTFLWGSFLLNHQFSVQDFLDIVSLFVL